MSKTPGNNDDSLDEEDMLPQYDTVNEEPYFVRESDGRVFSLEEAGQYSIDRDAARTLDGEEGPPDHGDVVFEDESELSQVEIDSEDDSMLRRQKQFRLAAEAVAAAMSCLPQVEKIVLFGSVAKQLEREVPRFRKLRRARIVIWHECKDVDLAVWVNSLDRLKALQKARSRAVNELMASRNIGVAHHQVDVFLMEPGTDRYLGRLCVFGQCPKEGKMDCRREGCGAKRFLEQHEGFVFDWLSASQGSITLYEKNHPVPGQG